MNRWQTFAIGAAGLVAVIYFPNYESVLAGVAAIVMVVITAAGFALTPKRDVFYVRTTVVEVNTEGEFVVGHDRVAVRVEMTRLWMLYVPVFVAVAFLVATWAHGTTWRIDLLDALAPPLFSNYPLAVYIVEVLGITAWILLTRWIKERNVFRDAQACSARSVSKSANALTYSFVTLAGDYFGGWTLLRSGLRNGELGALVFYNVKCPDKNVIAMALLFHRVTVIGRGLTDLDAETWSAKAVEIRTQPV